MNQFESIIKTLLEAEGYWVRSSLKINVSKLDKVKIGKHSIPRPEIDLLAYRPNSNKLIAMEVKSFLDSPGVRLNKLLESHEVPEGQYKLLTCENYRDIVVAQLKEDLITYGMALSDTTIQIGLAAGNVYGKDEPAIRELFNKKDWLFWGPTEIREKLKILSDSGYSNDTATMVSKILLR